MENRFENFLQSVRGKKIAVLGIGVSNTPLIELLLEAGAQVTACDRKPRESFGGLAEELERAGAQLRLGDSYLDGLAQDIIFRTPGMRPDIEPLARARKAGAQITSEMEVFFQVCPCRIIGVTGSDGKTTTTTLISEMLAAQGRTCHLGGNIGFPLLAKTGQMKPEDIAVVELSSFQLMTMTHSPHIAVVTNVSPNHLDMHRSMEEYIEAKSRIFAHQGEDGLLVYNYDNEITRGFGARAPGSVLPFSRTQCLDEGVFVKAGQIVLRRQGRDEAVLHTKDILLPGAHNVENYMAAIAATRGLASNEAVLQVARSFPGVEHRIELVREHNGVKYYNSSIDSSPTRTAAALRSFSQKTIVICGGYDKKIPFEPLGQVLVEKAKAVVLTGATADKIEAAVRTTPGYDPEKLPIVRKASFDDAVRTAAALASAGDVVILSPACASFDAFSNFAQRGQRFKQLVKELS